jgi:hypothetical protein
MAAEKISLYNIAGKIDSVRVALVTVELTKSLCSDTVATDLKNTTDDAIPNYLNSLKFKQTHFLTDVRLGLGYSAFLIAAACFAWDYKLGFESTKIYTGVAVALYTILNGGLTLWTMYVEKGVVYQGTSPDGEQVFGDQSRQNGSAAADRKLNRSQ